MKRTKEPKALPEPLREIAKTPERVTTRLEALRPKDATTELLEIFEALSFEEWCENFIRVKDRQGREVPFILGRVHREREAKKSRRLTEVGPRQIGKTLGELAHIHHDATISEFRAIVNRDIATQANASIVLPDDDSTTTALDKFDLMVRRTPRLLRPEKKVDRRDLKVFALTDSRVSIFTLGQGTPGQSYTIHRLLCSEAAHPGYTTELMKHLTPAVPRPNLGGHITWESVPYGPSGYFYGRYKNSREQDRLFVPWWWGEDFRSGDPDDWSDLLPLWEGEIEVVDTEHLRADQIRWWREQVFESDPDDFGPGGAGEAIARQKYPWNDIDCWFGAVGRPYIAPGVMRKHITHAREIASSAAQLVANDAGEMEWDLSRGGTGTWNTMN